MRENEFIATQYLDLTIRKINENKIIKSNNNKIDYNMLLPPSASCQVVTTNSETIEINVKKPKLSFSIASIIGLNE